jgi:hypothetical protein
LSRIKSNENVSQTQGFYMKEVLVSATSIASAPAADMALAANLRRQMDLWAIAVAASLTLFSTSPALAQGTAQERSACMGDALRFCSSDVPFVSEIESCLEQNIRRLNRACRREFLPNHKTKLKEEYFR